MWRVLSLRQFCNKLCAWRHNMPPLLHIDNIFVFIRQVTAVDYLRHQQQVDLWPFDPESGVRVTCDMGYLCTNFSFHRPLCSRVRPDVCDRQRDRHETKASLNASTYGGRGIIIAIITSCAGGRHNIPPPLQVDLWPWKWCLESSVTWATFVPILVFLCLSVLGLDPMYATDRQTSDAHHRLMPLP